MSGTLRDKIYKNRISLFVYIITLIISAVMLVIGHNAVYDEETMFLGGYDDGAASATVTEILSVDSETVTIEGQVIGENADIVFKCVILNGAKKGETVVAHETVTAYDAVPLKHVTEGDRVLIALEQDGEYDYYMHDYDRTMPLWVLGILFVALVLLFGRRKGVNTIISLSFTFAAVFIVFVPAVMSGQNIYLWSVMTCVYIIIMTLLITNGWNKKTLAAVIGCTSGVVTAGILTVITLHFLNLSGITSEDTIYIKQNFEIDLNALIFGGIILGAVGAVMDVSVSISSSLKELYDQVETPTFGKLVKSGITIGRDIMGTMANTLVLAYIGCELSATILSVAYSSSLTTLFSREKIVEEVMQALVGSIGILLTIPLTAVVSAALYMGLRDTFKHDKKRTIGKYDRYYVEPADEPSLFEHGDNE